MNPDPDNLVNAAQHIQSLAGVNERVVRKQDQQQQKRKQDRKRQHKDIDAQREEELEHLEHDDDMPDDDSPHIDFHA